MILILSNPDDSGHVQPVTAELSRRGEEFTVYDPALYPESSTVTVENATGGVRAFISWDGCDLDLSRVKSVWYRRPGDHILSGQLEAAEDEWLRTECAHLFRAMWQGTRSLWVSNPAAIRQANLKVLQLQTALKLGFVVPRFTITNEVDRARQFIDSCRDGTIAKVLGNLMIVYPHQACTLYTHLISPDDMDQIASVRLGPTFLQEFVRKTMDVRVTVFGEELFAVGIQSADVEAARVDFRRAEIYDLPHVVLTLPESLSSLCIELVRRLDLKFGAIDLLLTPEGEYVFLEINPNGQWYWLEWVTGVPLTESLCNLLAARPESR